VGNGCLLEQAATGGRGRSQKQHRVGRATMPNLP
jgi:hypothetical protein